jgi:hypothetical protein
MSRGNRTNLMKNKMFKQQDIGLDHRYLYASGMYFLLEADGYVNIGMSTVYFSSAIASYVSCLTLEIQLRQNGTSLSLVRCPDRVP